MRRIVIIAAGPAGVRCATGIKRRFPEDEINLILPPQPADKSRLTGPAGKRLADILPDTELLASREVGVVEATDIMPDLEKKELTVTSSRGQVTIRYSTLIIEVPAMARIPRQLQKARNLFSWPMPGFAAEPEALDDALRKAAHDGETILVAGSGAPALDAVLLARESGGHVHWLHTRENEDLCLEPHMLSLVLQHLGDAVTYTPLPGVAPEQLRCTLDADDGRLASVSLENGDFVSAGCCLWASPRMGRHPILREDGILLDEHGCIYATEGVFESLGLMLIGSGAALPPTVLQESRAIMSKGAGDEAKARLSALRAVDAVTSDLAPAYRSFGLYKAASSGICLIRAGLTCEEAARQGIEAEHAIAPLPDSDAQGATLVLSLVCCKKSRTLIGAHVLVLPGSDGRAENTAAVTAAEALAGTATAALGDGTPLDELLRQEFSGNARGLFASVLAILANKLRGNILGISPEEYLASREAGAEFFTLDLRALPDWQAGHVPGAYNIPLPQLKKRLQAEVPHFTPLVIVARDSNDAYVVACRLAALGAASLYVLDGGMRLWPYQLEKG